MKFLFAPIERQAAKWEELTLKADDADDNMGMPKTLYSHVHQLHNLESGADYELSIENRNKFGWSRPLQIEFSTLQTGKRVRPFSGPSIIS